MIALLCPTRKRAAQCRRMIESVVKTTGVDVAVYLAYDFREEDNYVSELLSIKGIPIYKLHMPDGMPTAHKWNRLAEHAMKDNHNLFMLAADDMVFSTPLWAEALLEHYSALDNKAHIYSLLDSRDADGTPHIIATREYIMAMGYFVPPLFLHWFIDTWTVAIGKANNCFTHMKDYLLMHDKPSDRGDVDETHSKIRTMGWHQRDTWVNEHCGHFLRSEIYRLSDASGRKLRTGS